MGVNALYLNPVFTAPSNHKYDVTDYEHVDPHFGGDAALAGLRQALDARGMRYLLDIVPNHCGYWHPWFEAARADAAAAEAEFFTFTRHPDAYASWLGVWTLPKLNYASARAAAAHLRGRGRGLSPLAAAALTRPTAGGWTWPTCWGGKGPASGAWTWRAASARRSSGRGPTPTCWARTSSTPPLSCRATSSTG